MEEMQVRDQENVIELDLRELWFLFRRHIFLLIVMALIGGAAAWSVCTFLITPTYEATSKLYCVSASSDSVVNLSDLQIGTSLAKDYEELILTRPMLESLIVNLELEDETVTSLREKISINNPSDTRILEITVTTESPDLSADIANEIAELAVTWLPEVMESRTPNIAEKAVAPTKQAAPSTVRNTVIAAFLAALLMYAVLALRFLLDDTVKTSEQMEKYFGMMPIAVIPMDKKIKKNKRGAKGKVK